jgi:hypothetical protein
MAEKIEKTEQVENVAKQPKEQKPLWKRIVKWVGITAAVIVGLFSLIMTILVLYLTPSRLTPMVEKYATDYLDGELKVAKVELSFWSTFPKLTLDIDSLCIISHSLRDLTPEQLAALPADADSLMTLRGFHGAINPFPLLVGRISLHDVVFDTPTANIIQVTDSIGNYQIIPPSEDNDTTSTTSIPDISINSFKILNAKPLRYRSLPDSVDITAGLENVDLDGPEAPIYRLTIEGNTKLPMLADFNFNDITFGLDGNVDWSAKNPYQADLSDVVITLDEYSAKFSANVDFTDETVLNSFKAKISDFPVQSALAHVPADFKELVAPLKTDLKPSLEMQLKEPWTVNDSILPSLTATLDIPSATATYENITLKKVKGKLLVDFDGKNIDSSKFELKDCCVMGDGVDFDLEATVTNAMSDPRVKGWFKGEIDLSNIPATIAKELPCTISGRVEGNSEFEFAMSELSEEEFHEIQATGNLNFYNIKAHMPETFDVYIRKGEFKFGTSDSFVKGGQRVDSLLRVSLNIDTLAATAQGMNVELKNFKAGLGSANRHSSSDTTAINPFGGKISVERLKFDSPADTLRARLKDASITGSLQRYQGNAKAPQIDLGISAGRIMFGQGLNKVSLKETELTVNLNKKITVKKKDTNVDAATKAARRAERHAADSIAALQAAANGNIDMTLDKDSRKLLRQWDYKGSLKAKKGNLTTPYFPLRNRLTNIDLRFNSDSIVLSKLLYKAGQSDFLISGTVSNIRKALTSKRDNTLGITLSVKSDTINVNEIVKALFAGPSVAAATDSAAIWNDNDSDATKLELKAETTPTQPFILPHNINAQFRMRAENILYSDLELKNFRGDLLLYDGALNLRNLSASADVGSVSLNGLYSSANPDSLQFGLGMKIDKFKIEKLYSIIPGIDTLMPAMQNFAGVVNADVAVTTDLEQNMDINIPSLRAAIKIEGDSLVLIDPDTFKTISKWLLFKNKDKNMIDHMSVEVVVENSVIELYPFMFDMDRYRLGVMGSNDLAMNLNYHVSVLKSPIPFKFGINVKGTPEKLKIRLGRAKVKENMIGERQLLADNTRINLVEQINKAFRQGLSKAKLGKLNFSGTGRKNGVTSGVSSSAMQSVLGSADDDRLTYADSLRMISAGVIENPDTARYRLTIPTTTTTSTTTSKSTSKSKKK